MTSGKSPTWLSKLERHFGWLAVPQISILLVTLQALGFLMVTADPIWIERLSLLPERVTGAGEYWRLITFLAIPLSLSPLWMLFGLIFLYYILNTIEHEWGALKTTLYVLVSLLLTVAVSFALGYPVMDITDFQSSLFLAAAALYPEMEVRLYFAIPVKMKWLGWLSLAFVGWKFAVSGWDSRIYLLAIYSNYLLFFGPALLERGRQYLRRRDFRRKMGR